MQKKSVIVYQRAAWKLSVIALKKRKEKRIKDNARLRPVVSRADLWTPIKWHCPFYIN